MAYSSTLIASEEEAEQARKVVEHYRAQLKALNEGMAEDPALQATECEHTSSMLAMTQRMVALWEAGIREEVPGRPDPVAPSDVPLTGGDPDVDERLAQRALKCAEIANIDRQVGIALDRIADWRRHRAWLAREVAELEAQAARPDTEAP